VDRRPAPATLALTWNKSMKKIARPGEAVPVRAAAGAQDRRTGAHRSAGAPPGRVRIIGGQYRRTPLTVVGTTVLRPTPDRVRVTVFNWLEHLLGAPSALRALDLFAGTGALGLEMASRGAREVLLVEADARASAALRAVVARLGAAGVRVEQADWQLALARLGPARFEVIFLDPPFEAGILARALAASVPHLAPGGLIYAEGPAPLGPAALAALGLELVRAGHAGAVFFHLLRALSC
jgi:16S rRNA (guanine966-N2)-methyltransferase